MPNLSTYFGVFQVALPGQLRANAAVEIRFVAQVQPWVSKKGALDGCTRPLTANRILLAEKCCPYPVLPGAFWN